MIFCKFGYCEHQVRFRSKNSNHDVILSWDLYYLFTSAAAGTFLLYDVVGRSNNYNVCETILHSLENVYFILESKMSRLYTYDLCNIFSVLTFIKMLTTRNKRHIWNFPPHLYTVLQRCCTKVRITIIIIICKLLYFS